MMSLDKKIGVVFLTFAATFFLLQTFFSLFFSLDGSDIGVFHLVVIILIFPILFRYVSKNVKSVRSPYVYCSCLTGVIAYFSLYSLLI